MANNKPAVLFAVLLVFLFLFLLTAPIVLVIGHYSGLLQLPRFITYRNVSIAATAGLFLIPVLLIFLAAIIVAIKKRRLAVPSATVAKVAVAGQAQVGSSRNSANGGMRNRAHPDLRLSSPAEAGLAPARYQWEGMFGREGEEHKERYREKRRPVSKPYSANLKAVAAVVIVIVFVVLVLLANATKQGSIAGANKTATAAANVIPAETPSNVTGETQVESTSTGPSQRKLTWEQNPLSRILAQVFAGRNAPNETQAEQGVVEKPAAAAADEIKPQQPQRNFTSVQLSAAAKKAFGSVKSFGGKIKGKFVSSVSKVKSAVAKVPDAAWQKIAVAAVALLVAVTFFYSHRTSQLGEIPKWFREWLGGLAAILAAARKNRLKVLLGIILIAVVCAAIAAVMFRKWIVVKFPSVSASSLMDAAVNALLAVRDFVSAYRLYILIGIFALLAIIGVLFIYETRGKKEKNM